MNQFPIIEKSDLIIETFPVGSFQCNCSIIYSKTTKEALVIDPGNDLDHLSRLITDRELKVKKLVHTHAHFDHIGCSGDIKNKIGCDILLHKDDLTLYEGLSQQAMFFGNTVGSVSTVDCFLEDEQHISFESNELGFFLKTLHTPGHTPGSCSFYTDFFDGPLLFSGDTLFNGSIGRTDFPGGDFETIIKSIKQRIFLLPDETSVVTGHGPNTMIYREKRENPFLS